jgi:hypothetical protein
MNFEEILEARRDSVRETIQPLSREEVVALGEKVFPYADDPWREQFFTFLESHPGAAFYHASFPDEVEILYCHSEKRGIWFVPRQGVGVLSESALQALAEITSGAA